MAEQENEGDLFSNPHPIAECQDDVALCFIPEPDEGLGIDGFWQVLQRVEDGEWINERCMLRQPSHFVPTDELCAKVSAARSTPDRQTSSSVSEVPTQLQAVDLNDGLVAERLFKTGQLKAGQPFTVYGLMFCFDRDGIANPVNLSE